MREGNPTVGDRVRVKETGHVGTVEYLEHHHFDVAPTRVGVRYDNPIDVPWTLNGGSRREGDEFSVDEIEPINFVTNCRRAGLGDHNAFAKEKRRASNGI